MDEKSIRIFNLTSCSVLFALSIWTLVGDNLSQPFSKLPLFNKLNLNEVRDRLSPLFLVLVVLTVLVLSRRVKINSISIQNTIAAITTIGFGFSISSYLIDDDVAWAGLGNKVAIVCFVMSFVALYFWPRVKKDLNSNKKIASSTNVLCLVVLMVAYLPSIAQFSGGIIDLFASSTVFNELLLPVTGITPLGNFASQYTSMLGWPLLAVKGFSPELIMNSVLVWLFVLTIFQVFAIAGIGKCIFRQLPFPLILLYASSLMLMKGEKQNDIAGSIVGSFFSIPSRTFFPSVLGLILIASLFERRSQKRYQVALGALLPITALNNLEFGVPAVIASLFVVFATFRIRQIGLRTIFLILAPAFTSFGLIAVAFAIRSAPLDLGLWTAMVRTQGSGGYMNVPMPIVGTYLIVFAILGAGVVIGLLNFSSIRDVYVLKSGATAIYAGVWGILSMPYYTGRSWPSHIQVFLVPVTICIFGVAGVFYYSGLLTSKKLSLTQLISRIPLSIVLLLPIATLITAPNPKTEWSRATGGGSEWSLTSQSKTKVVTSVLAAVDRYGLDINESVYFGDQYASTVELITGMRNGLGLNTLEYSLVSAELRELACRRLPDLNPKFVVSQNDDTRVNFVGPTLLDSSCPGMKVLYAPDDIGVTIFSYTKPIG
jgi:hypothetical protein